MNRGNLKFEVRKVSKRRKIFLRGKPGPRTPKTPEKWLFLGVFACFWGLARRVLEKLARARGDG